jgi:hypothetical protein
MGRNKTPVTDRLTSEDAVKLIEEWADQLELDTERELYNIVVEEIRYPVRVKRLTFDVETEEFTYQLKTPVKSSSGEIKAIIKIRETTMKDKKILQKFKDDESIDAATAMMAKYTGLAVTEVSQLIDKDTSNINAVISGFITQVLPEKKR